MRRHILLTVLVAVLLASAGCLAVGAPVSEDSTRAQSSSIDSSYTITEETVTDTNTLVGAHTQILQRNSFTVDVTVTIVGEDYRGVANRTWQFDPTQSVRGRLYENLSVSGDPPAGLPQDRERVVYREGETTYEYVPNEAGSTVRRIQLLNTPVKANAATQRQTLVTLETLDNATVETVTRNGKQFYRITQSLPETRIATNRSVELLVSENGLIREMEKRETQRGPNGAMRVVSHIEITNVGETTVQRPEWYDEAVAKTD